MIDPLRHAQRNPLVGTDAVLALFTPDADPGMRRLGAGLVWSAIATLFAEVKTPTGK